MPKMLGVTLVAVVGLSITGCDDEDVGGDAERYCELSRELDEAAAEHFDALEAAESATEDDFVEAERHFVEDNEDELDELIETAPAEIRGDVETFVGAMRSGGLTAEGGPPDAVIVAQEGVFSWEEANCT